MEIDKIYLGDCLEIIKVVPIGKRNAHLCSNCYCYVKKEL